MTLDARLLCELRSTGVHLTPGDLAAQAGATRLEVEAALERLREAGFDIEVRPGLGCRLVGAPDRLIADDLHSRVRAIDLAREILVFEETSSTNDVAMRLGREGHPGGLVVFAELQTAGRGRFGRRWESGTRSGLWFSLLLRPAWPLQRWARLTTWAGVAVAATVEHALGRPVHLKWPNDIHVEGRKVAGILTECASDTSGRLFAVVGIGLNVNQDTFPAELAGTAVSLRQIAGQRIKRPPLAATLLGELDRRLAAVESAFDQLVAEAARRSPYLGCLIRLHAADSVLEGIADSLDEEGNLLLRMNDGSLRRVTAGEITSRKPISVPAPD